MKNTLFQSPISDESALEQCLQEIDALIKKQKDLVDAVWSLQFRLDKASDDEERKWLKEQIAKKEKEITNKDLPRQIKQLAKQVKILEKTVYKDQYKSDNNSPVTPNQK